MSVNILNMARVMVILHAYQPPLPVQEKWVIEKVAENCYKPVFERILSNDVRLVVNMNASLSENLVSLAPHLISLIKQSVEQKKVELLGSGAYHPIFPLIGDHWGQRQVELNHDINTRVFGDFHPIGFWPPELAVDEDTFSLVRKNQYLYCVVPETTVPSVCTYGLPDGELILLPRDKDLSNTIAFKGVDSVDDLVSLIDNKYGNSPCVLAMDMETFGEHNTGYYEFLFEFLTHPRVQTLTFRDLNLRRIPKVDKIIPSSWSTETHHLKKGIPYPLWDHPNNPLHSLILDHMDLIEIYVDGIIERMEDYEEFETLFLKSQHSCQLWWADGFEGRWSPSMVTKGLNLQMKVILNSPADVKEISERITKRIYRAIRYRSLNSEG